ncbi:MAG: phosphoribosylaminoimidazolesuccinocarboxamide synthase [Flavobacteriia bacterium]|nr:phosphoribosylaminoimidazolesuccinocarboxamide synthase [Flavobacteriia bacterium]
MYQFPGQISYYKGKVRDVYTLEDERILLIASNRISAFDFILPKEIPYKGQVLNQIAAYFLKHTQNIVPNWYIDSPDPSVSIGKKCEPIRIEMVIRGYLAGHAARIYKTGQRKICGITLPNGLKENDPLPEPIITPTLKAEEGHDEDISKEDILKTKVVSEKIYEQLEHYTKLLFQQGTEMAKKRGLILVDTKYEFGTFHNEVLLMDEVHTPDSSRYFYLEGYEERQAKNENQKQLSKEFVRQWLIQNDFQGLEGQKMPDIPDEFVHDTSERYIELYEKITGSKFIKEDEKLLQDRIYNNIINYLK